MFSPGTQHLRVPRDYEENLEYRKWVLKKASAVNWQKRLWMACAKDILFYVNTFVWQYNPQHKGDEVGPFITWDFQDGDFLEILSAIHDDEDLVIQKSREMGLSWMCLIVMDWLSQFHERKKFLLISRSEEAVDRPDDPDCLMWKIDFMHEYLPDWMIAGQIVRRKMGIKYLRTNSTITGQASTGKAGVGGRATAAFIDEFSQIREGREVLHRTADTTKCRIFNFTHTGTDNAAYEISQRVDVRQIVAHWSQHPDKKQGLYYVDPESRQVKILDQKYEFPPDYQFVRDGSPSGGPYPGVRSVWYDKECQRRQSSRAVAMDLDINPKGATHQFFDPLIIQDLKAGARRTVIEPFWTGELDYDPDLGLARQLVPNEGGKIKLWLNLLPTGKPPKGKYAFGGDVSTGTGATPSCLCGMNVETGEKILEYADAWIEPKTFGAFMVAIGSLFCDEEEMGAYLAWEMNGPGIVASQKILGLHYRRIYYRMREDAVTLKRTENPGWYATKDTKIVLMNDYRHALNTGLYCNRSLPALDECLSYVYRNGTVEHSKQNAADDPSGAATNHGDLVVADALTYRAGKGLRIRIEKKEENEVKVGSLAWRRELRKNRQQDSEFVFS